MKKNQKNFLQNFKMKFADSYHGGGWHSNKINAFTLIELLAIIVILAIIAVITVPIILNVIDNAKSGSVIDSAYGYKDAVQKFYVSKLYEDANFKFDDGTYTVETLKTMGVSVDGTIPTDDSWVKIENNQVIDYSLKFDEWVVNYDITTKKTIAIKNGTVELQELSSEELEEINNIKTIVQNYINLTLEKYSNEKVDFAKRIYNMKVDIPNDMDEMSWISYKYIDLIAGTPSEGEIDDYLMANDFSIKVGIYVIDYDENEPDKMKVTKNGMLKNVELVKTEKPDGKKYYNSEWVSTNPIYFNPGPNGTTCTKQDYNNNPNKLGNSGCMKWYAYSENTDGTINMILDHNTIPKLAWVLEEDYDAGNGIPQKAKDVGLTYPNISVENQYGLFNGDDTYKPNSTCPGNWNKGPITLLYRLQQDTSSWSSNVISRDNYKSYTNKNKYFDNSNNDNPNYTINYSRYNARLITAQEVAYITNVSFDERTTTGYTSFNSTTYAWLLENLYTPPSLPYGYWTASSVADRSFYSWHITISGFIDLNNVGNSSDDGLRPVITVSSSVLAGS